MPYRPNPFVERMSERTSDQEFITLFSPKILERIASDALDGGVQVYHSPPGAGKTTLLRAFTPAALRAFWNSRGSPQIHEPYQYLAARGIVDDQTGPRLLGVLLSCASGYADLPSGAAEDDAGVLRALLDCRVVLRALRSLAALLGVPLDVALRLVRLEYDDAARDLRSVPTHAAPADLLGWAEGRERDFYRSLDSVRPNPAAAARHARFEGVLWLQSVRFLQDGVEIAPLRLLMIDDLHKLRQGQRSMLIEELAESRPRVPVWLAERSVALGAELLAQGTREGRDLRYCDLGGLWKGQHQFAAFAQNVLDRRLQSQTEVPATAFSQYLRDTHLPAEVAQASAKRAGALRERIGRYRAMPRYARWVGRAEERFAPADFESLLNIMRTRILAARDELRQQLSLDLGPLPPEQLEERDSPQVQAAAEIFLHEELRIPYYFGAERLCALATNNAEELLALAAALYEGIRAKRTMRRPELVLSPLEQERLLKGVAKKKREFIPKNHTQGTRAQLLLDAVGAYCRERTFLPNAPYAPGVTGVRLAQSQLAMLRAGRLGAPGERLKQVLAECVAENLLAPRPSQASTSRESGTVLYLNRTLCMHYDLPLQLGGWQDVAAEELVGWMERGRQPRLLETL